jgi:hypothetical protein
MAEAFLGTGWEIGKVLQVSQDTTAVRLIFKNKSYQTPPL